MPDKSPAEKLLIEPGQRAAVLNAPEGYPAALAVPTGVNLHTALDGAFDNILFFVRDKAQLQREAAAVCAAVKPRGILWIGYPKQTSKIKTDINRDINRDIIWQELQATGWESVAIAVLDDTWSALRLRPSTDVKSRQA